MKGFIFGFVSTVAVAVSAPIACLRLGAAQVRGDVDAPAWQSALIHFAVRASVQRSVRNVRRSEPQTDADLIAGGKLYLNGCVGCHGRPGQRRRAEALFSPPPELAYVGTRYSEPEVYWIIKHGIRRSGMSAYSPFYTERELWALAAFVGRMRDLPASVRDTIK